MDTRHRPFFLLVLAVATLAMGVLLRGFWQPIFWALVLGILFRPVETWLSRILGDRPTFAALLIVLAVMLFVLFPGLGLAFLIIEQAVELVQGVTSGEIAVRPIIAEIERRLPDFNALGADLGIDFQALSQRLQSAAVSAGQFVLSLLLGAGQNVASIALQFFLMLYLMFFILRDGDAIYRAVYDAIPLEDAQKTRFFEQFAVVSVATLKGTVVIGLVQGSLGGFIFWLLGIQGAAFWGSVMAVLSVIPALGPTLVWLPAAIILIAGGEIASGLILIAFGSLVIATVDNVLRPVLVGRDTKMPDYIVLLSTLGGLGLFGMTGIVLGPVIAAFFLAAWAIFAEEPDPQY